MSFQQQPEVFYKKAVLTNFAILKKHMCWSFLFIRKTLQHRIFLVNIAKLLRTPILKNIYERLLLSIAPLGKHERGAETF